MISFPYRCVMYAFPVIMTTMFPFDFDLRFTYPLNSPLSRTNVYVVSDSDYKEFQQKRAEQEITVLESKRNRLEAAIADIDAEIKNIKDTHKLLPDTKPSNPIKELLE